MSKIRAQLGQKEKNRTRRPTGKTKWRSVLFATLMLASVFAGCLDLDAIAPQASGEDGAQEEDQTVHNETQDAADGDATNVSMEETPPAPPVQPPTARLSADYTTGQENFTVTFTLEGTDPEGGTLDWVLDYADGSEVDSGDRLPAELVHTFTEEEEYQVMLMVFGNRSMGIDMLMITVLEGPNDAQPGESTHCLHRTMIQAGLSQAVLPPTEAAFDAIVEVDPGTDYWIRLNESSIPLPDSMKPGVYIDFFDGDENRVGDSAGQQNGTVPSGAEYGIVCAANQTGLDEGVPVPSGSAIPIPQPAQGWVYQDGIIAPSP